MKTKAKSKAKAKTQVSQPIVYDGRAGMVTEVLPDGRIRVTVLHPSGTLDSIIAEAKEVTAASS